MKTLRLPELSMALALAATPALAPRLLARDTAALDLARQLNKAFIEVADEISQSVVVIDVAKKEDGVAGMFGGQAPWLNPDLLDQLPEQFRRFFEGQRDPQKDPRKDSQKEPKKRAHPRVPEPQFNGQGSGFVVSEEGYIVTNNHVVEDAQKIRVRFQDGREVEGEIRGVDPKSDLAVIKLKERIPGLKTVKWADSDKVRVGEFAIAIGAPFDLEYSVTFGHVSAKSRGDVVPRWALAQQPGLDQDFIQTDASINPGNSGGPLVNIDGEVIGINSMIRGLNSGIGFAIPSNLARSVSEAIIAEGKFTRSWLGIGIESLRQNRTYREMIKGVQDGVIVNSFVENGPAAKSELKAGDVIAAVDGRAVATPEQLKAQIRNKPVGAIVKLDVYRRDPKGKDKTLEIKVKTEAWPDEGVIPVGARKPAPVESESAEIGVTVKPINKDTITEYSLKEGAKGVVITGVEEDSLAAREGLRVGDVISEVNGEVVASPKEFAESLRGVRLKDGMTLTVISGRDGVARFRVLKDR